MSPAFAKQKYCSKACFREVEEHGKNNGPCSIEGCESAAHAAKLCPKHYQRQRLYGNPEAPWREAFRGNQVIASSELPKKVRPHGSPWKHPKEGCDCEPCLIAYYSWLWVYHHTKDPLRGIRYSLRRERAKASKIEREQTAVAKQQRRDTLESLRSQVAINWRDDPTPFSWQLETLYPNGSEKVPAWDRYRSTLDTPTETPATLGAKNMLDTGCPTVQLLSDKALLGIQLSLNERALLASALSHRVAS